MEITSLNSHLATRNPSTRCWKKNGAENSAFSKFKARYCSPVSRGKVLIKVCNVKFREARAGGFHKLGGRFQPWLGQPCPCPSSVLNVQTAGEMQEPSQRDQSKAIHWCSIGSCKFSRSPQRLIAEELDRVFLVAADEDTSSQQSGRIH
jgi:hypothetical protein